MKKLLALVASFAMITCLLAGCNKGTQGNNSSNSGAVTPPSGSGSTSLSGENSGAYANFPTGNITYICSGSAGGGLDLCARFIAPYIANYLPGNGTITVENVTGGSNWNAYNRLITSKPDGLTICTLATPQFSNYLNQSMQIPYTMDSYTPLANCVTDYCCISVRTDDARFTDVNSLTDLAEFLKANPDTDYLVSLTSGGGADELVMYEFEAKAGVENLEGINYAEGINASRAGFLGGETDIYSGKVGDTLNMFNEGTVKVLGVFAAERSSLMPDVPTGAEQGFDIVLGSDRGIIVPNDMDPELYDLLLSAVEAASNDPAYLEQMAAGGYEVNFIGGEEYVAYLREIETMVKGYADILGYNN